MRSLFSPRRRTIVVAVLALAVAAGVYAYAATNTVPSSSAGALIVIDRRACSFRRHQQPRQRVLAVEIGKPALLAELAAAHDQHPVEIAGETGPM